MLRERSRTGFGLGAFGREEAASIPLIEKINKHRRGVPDAKCSDLKDDDDETFERKLALNAV